MWENLPGIVKLACVMVPLALVLFMLGRKKWSSDFTGVTKFLYISLPLVLAVWLGMKWDVLPAPKFMTSSVPQNLQVAADFEPVASDGTVQKIPLPSFDVSKKRGSTIRHGIMAWNSQFGMLYANGGPETTEGSIMESAGLKVKYIRNDDCTEGGKMLMAFAEAFAKGDPNPTSGYHFYSPMGDYGATFLAGINAQCEKLGPDYYFEIIGSPGRSYGEDKFMGPAEWQQDPQLARGKAVATVARDGDWNLVAVWCQINNVPLNPDLSSYDPNALNVMSVAMYTDAGKSFNNRTAETRPVIRDGKKTKETVTITADAVSSWTPVDVDVFFGRGGVVTLFSTKDNSNQMPNVIVGLHAWNIKNKDIVAKYLEAIWTGSDQVKNFEDAANRAAQASAKTYLTPQSPAEQREAGYWLTYFYGREVTYPGTNEKVVLGGSQVLNLSDNLTLYGVEGGRCIYCLDSYEQFGKLVSTMYPLDLPSFPPYSKVVNTEYMRMVAARTKHRAPSEKVEFSDKPITPDRVVGRRVWAIEFEQNSSALTYRGQQVVDSVITLAGAGGDLAIEIHGYTSSEGSNETNDRLSRDRCQSTINYMQQRSPGLFGKNRLRPVPHGEDPQYFLDRTGLSPRNRRVEIVWGRQG